jgi:hypothetical protein
MGDRQSVEVLQWQAYIGRKNDNLIHAGIGREVRLPEVPNLKVDGFFRETNEVFEYLGCFWQRVSVLYAQSGQAHQQYPRNTGEQI